MHNWVVRSRFGGTCVVAKDWMEAVNLAIGEIGIDPSMFATLKAQVHESGSIRVSGSNMHAKLLVNQVTQEQSEELHAHFLGATPQSPPPEPVPFAEVLFEQGAQIHAAPSYGTAAAAGLEVLSEVVSAEAGHVLLTNGQALAYTAAFGPPAAELQGRRLAFGYGIAGFVFHTGRAIIVEDVGSDERHDQSFEQVTGYTIEALLAVPVNDSQDRAWGVMELLNPPKPFEQEHLIAAEAVARVLGESLGQRQEEEQPIKCKS